jgi:ADP-ribose pyrophosphatase YjhB (NUDIX family)
MSGPPADTPVEAGVPLPAPHTRVGVGGVLLRDGRVLVNRASYRSRFTIPSGFVEAGETLEATLAREFEEEAGIRVRSGPLLLVRHEVTDGTESGVYFAFVVDHVAGEPAARPPEIAESREVPVPEALEAPWISELSRLVIRLAALRAPRWTLDPLRLPSRNVRAMEIFHGSSE